MGNLVDWKTLFPDIEVGYSTLTIPYNFDDLNDEVVFLKLPNDLNIFVDWFSNRKKFYISLIGTKGQGNAKKEWVDNEHDVVRTISKWMKELKIDNRPKQVLVVRKDLEMNRGKIAAQSAHAAMSFLTSRLEQIGPDEYKVKLTDTEAYWAMSNFTKACVKVHSEQELLDIVAKAKEAGLVAELIQDNGRTEFHGVPTYTAAAIGPDYPEKIDPVCGHLKLYS